jgi:hypothetical protein
VLSKILAFTTALTLFLPMRSRARTGPPAAEPEPAASQPGPARPEGCRLAPGFRAG